jgi:hypothetical protein
VAGAGAVDNGDVESDDFFVAEEQATKPTVTTTIATTRRALTSADRVTWSGAYSGV